MGFEVIFYAGGELNLLVDYVAQMEHAVYVARHMLPQCCFYMGGILDVPTIGFSSLLRNIAAVSRADLPNDILYFIG